MSFEIFNSSVFFFPFYLLLFIILWPMWRRWLNISVFLWFFFFSTRPPCNNKYRHETFAFPLPIHAHITISWHVIDCGKLLCIFFCLFISFFLFLAKHFPHARRHTAALNGFFLLFFFIIVYFVSDAPNAHTHTIRGRCTRLTRLYYT